MNTNLKHAPFIQTISDRGFLQFQPKSSVLLKEHWSLMGYTIIII